MVAANHVPVGGHQDGAADRDAAGGKHLAVESDVAAVAELDVAVLTRQDRVAADEDTVANPDPLHLGKGKWPVDLQGRYFR